MQNSNKTKQLNFQKAALLTSVGTTFDYAVSTNILEVS